MELEKMLAFGLAIVLLVSGLSMALSSSRSVTETCSTDDIESDKVSFVGGNGTESEPYLIENTAQLQKMNQDLNAHYKLINNISAGATKDWNDGRGFMPVGGWNNKFYGGLDGSGFVISDLYINRPDDDDVGLFGCLGEGASVEKIGIVDSYVNGNEYVGGIVGENGGMITNCYAVVNVSGNEEVGGLVGEDFGGTISNTYAAGDVSGSDNTGGLVGDSKYVRGFNSFWDVNKTGQDGSAGGTGKTTAEMKDIDTFTNGSTAGLRAAWDFVGHPNNDSSDRDIWDIDESGQINDGYPYLKSEGGSYDGDSNETDGGDPDDGIPGFTTVVLLTSISVVALYKQRER